MAKPQDTWDWFKIVMPIVTILCIPLIALIYNNMAEAVEKKADKDTTEMSISLLKETLKDKVDNKTLQQMIAIQETQLGYIEIQIQDQKEIDKEMLKTLQDLNIQLKLIEQKIQ